MSSPYENSISFREIGETLANFSLDRETVQFAINRLPDSLSINKVAVEYEIQILKILSVGWAISFFMENHPEKMSLMEFFWEVMYEFSKSISSVTSASIGKEVDYFRTLKERIDTYLSAMSEISLSSTDPGSVIGPTFARLCESADNVHVIMAGNRVFNMALEGVKQYLDSVFNRSSLSV